MHSLVCATTDKYTISNLYVICTHRQHCFCELTLTTIQLSLSSSTHSHTHTHTQTHTDTHTQTQTQTQTHTDTHRQTHVLLSRLDRNSKLASCTVSATAVVHQYSTGVYGHHLTGGARRWRSLAAQLSLSLSLSLILSLSRSLFLCLSVSLSLRMHPVQANIFSLFSNLLLLALPWDSSHTYAFVSVSVSVSIQG